MTMPTRRRSGRGALQPGDIALIAFAGGVLLISFASTVGVALACALFGDGWAWPHGVANVARLLGGLLTGAPTRGLPAATRAAAPGPAAIYTLVAVTVLAIVVAMVVAVRWLVDLLGEGRASTGGFATRAQARRVLSGRALPRRRVREIRPDLFDPADQAAPGEDSPGRDQP